MGELPPDLKQWMRFSPPDEKVIDFLRSKITGKDNEVEFIFEAQNCRWDPWDLRTWCLFWLDDVCGIKMEYPEWWVFLPQDRNGKRAKRATNAGFWKVTGRPHEINSDSGLIGKKNYLVFYTGTRPGNKTDWVMHEYYTTLKELDGTLPGQKPFVLCCLSCNQKKSSTGPNFNFAGTAVSSPTTALEVQAEATTPQIFYETISNTSPVDCGDKSFSAHAAENQLGEDAATEEDLQLEEMISEEMISEVLVDFEILNPSSTSLLNRSTGSSPTTANSLLEEFFESDIASALASPASDLTKIFPHINFDGTTSNDMPRSNCNHVSYNAYTAKSDHAAENQLGEDAATEEDLQLEEMISEEMISEEMISEVLVDFEILNPSSTSLLNRSTGSSPTTANSLLEEFFESDIASALASPASDLTKIFPHINFDGTTSNDMPRSNCNHVSYNAYTAKSEVSECNILGKDHTASGPIF